MAWTNERPTPSGDHQGPNGGRYSPTQASTPQATTLVDLVMAEAQVKYIVELQAWEAVVRVGRRVFLVMSHHSEAHAREQLWHYLSGPIEPLATPKRTRTTSTNTGLEGIKESRR